MLAAGVRTGLGDEWVRVGAMKMTCDGSISERTARLAEPYVGRPDDHGMWVTGEDELYTTLARAHEAGWQLGVHANGDEAIARVLGLYERLQRERPRRDPRFRLEHCTVITDALVARIKALGAIPTPFSTYVYYHGEKMAEYGAARLDRMFALRSFLDAGVRATQASDYPPGPFEPMMALQSEVTRTDMKGTVWGPRQRITVEEAIRVGTLHGAYASFEEAPEGLDRSRQAGRPGRPGPRPLPRGPRHARHDSGRADDGRREVGFRGLIRARYSAAGGIRTDPSREFRSLRSSHSARRAGRSPRCARLLSSPSRRATDTSRRSRARTSRPARPVPLADARSISSMWGSLDIAEKPVSDCVLSS